MTTNSARTDGDSWGPGSSVGATATMVAAGRALASKGPDALLQDPLADPLVRASASEQRDRTLTPSAAAPGR